MDLFFPEDNLQRMTPEETHITALRAEPFPDGVRLRVDLEITPFQKRPHLEILLTNCDGDEAASASIVEPLGWKLEFTLHRRGELHNPYTIEARLFYPDGPSAAPKSYTFDINQAPGGD